MEKESINLLIAGEAGQGLVTIGELLSKVLVRSGFSILVTQSYQSRIRGGHNTFAVHFGTGEILAPRESIDILVALNEESVRIHESELSDSGLVLVDHNAEVKCPRCVKIPFSELSEELFSNVVALGLIGFLLGLEPELVLKTVEDYFGKKKSSMIQANADALDKARGWASENIKDLILILKQPSTRNRKIMLNGNEAIGLGAISAGVKFCAFYPMTPSTSVALTLAANAKKMGLIVEQAEDEIAAINMAIGAAYTGAPSLVTTSGGGFALMVEGVSLAAMTETPVVIVLAQRPGPATGLPTRTEQGELEFVLHCGHGEFPRAIFAPGTPGQCFHLTRKAFEVAEKAQGPVFILTDQFLADSFRDLEPVDVESLLPTAPKINDKEAAAPYNRYRITDSGVSPRLMPGMSKNLVVADSDEHTEDGHLTEDLGVRTLMADKRLRKEKIIIDELIAPEYIGDDDPELLLVCWGSTRGSALESARVLRARGRRAAVLHFSQVWPLLGGYFLARLQSAKKVVCVESNAGGQFGRLIHGATGFKIENLVPRYDGLPITPEYILKKL